jgi:hypothetical protein
MLTDGARASLKVVQQAWRARTPQAPARRLRLLTAACARRVQHLVPSPELLECVDRAERAGEGKVPPAALRRKHRPDAVREFLERGHRWDSPAAQPVLADALEDAGCPCAELLAHLRRHPVHARGCWALGRLLIPPSSPRRTTGTTSP